MTRVQESSDIGQVTNQVVTAAWFGYGVPGLKIHRVPAVTMCPGLSYDCCTPWVWGGFFGRGVSLGALVSFPSPWVDGVNQHKN